MIDPTLSEAEEKLERSLVLGDIYKVEVSRMATFAKWDEFDAKTFFLFPIIKDDRPDFMETDEFAVSAEKIVEVDGDSYSVGFSFRFKMSQPYLCTKSIITGRYELQIQDDITHINKLLNMSLQRGKLGRLARRLVNSILNTKV
jgi:hypothetical protein